MRAAAGLCGLPRPPKAGEAPATSADGFGLLHPQAAIHGLDGNPWAQSPGFAVTPAEAAKLVAGFTTADGLYSGIHIGGVKFMFLRADPESIHGKQVCLHSKWPGVQSKRRPVRPAGPAGPAGLTSIEGARAGWPICEPGALLLLSLHYEP